MSSVRSNFGVDENWDRVYVSFGNVINGLGVMNGFFLNSGPLEMIQQFNLISCNSKNTLSFLFISRSDGR